MPKRRPNKQSLKGDLPNKITFSLSLFKGDDGYLAIGSFDALSIVQAVQEIQST